MTSSRFHAMKWTLGAALAVLVTVCVPAVQAQDAPIDIAVAGDAVPGGAVTVTLTTTDGRNIKVENFVNATAGNQSFTVGSSVLTEAGQISAVKTSQRK